MHRRRLTLAGTVAGAVLAITLALTLSAGASPKKGYKIFLLPKTTTIPVFTVNAKGAKKAAKELGDTLTYNGIHNHRFDGDWVLAVAIVAAVAALVAAVVVQRMAKRGRWIWVVLLAGIAVIALGNWWNDGPGKSLLATIAAAIATSGPFVIAGANRQQFENYRARLGGTGIARERVLASRVTAPTCGVSTTFGKSTNGLRSGGSGSS